MKRSKKMRSITCLMAMLLLLLGLCLQPATALAAGVDESAEETLESDDALLDAQASSGSVAVYRLYSKSTGEHLYTTDVNEKNTLYQEYEWGYEGVAWYAPTSGTAVYRLYQPGLRNHLYTTDKNEVKVLTSKYGWKKDNGGNPLFYSGGSQNIYRVYNKAANGMHHLTTDKVEYNALPKSGWKQEGAKLKCVKVGSPITTQYYKLGAPQDGFYALEGTYAPCFIFKSNGNGTYKCTEVAMTGANFTTFTYKQGTGSYKYTTILQDGSRNSMSVTFSKVSAGYIVANGKTYTYRGTTFSPWPKSYSYYIDRYK